jgi:hypothetical protein
MPPILRPRSVVNQETPLIPKKRKKTTNREVSSSASVVRSIFLSLVLQGQKSIEAAPQTTPQARKGSGKRQRLSTRATGVQKPKPSAPSKERNRPDTSHPTKDLKSRQPQKGPKKAKEPKPASARPQSVSLSKQTHPRSTKVSPPTCSLGDRQTPEAEISLQADYISSWASEVREASVPDGPILPTIDYSSGIQNRVGSVPWFRSYGYGLSDEDMATGTGINTDASQYTRELLSLHARNIRDKAVVDQEDKKWIEEVILSVSNETGHLEEERNWEADMSKCLMDDEAIFQRTIMIDLISRHQLANTLDWTCESQWCCPSMPQKGELGNRVSKPKPDLAVAFQAEAVLPFFQLSDLGDYRGIMCPELYREKKCDRAFHFLSIEAKGARADLSNSKAIRQNFNTATQALHNMYFFMKMAGEEHLKIFYEKVRFYSVVATNATFYVRVHRAIKLDKGRIKPDYPLGFVFDDVLHHQGSDYKKAKTTGIIKNILVEYGLKVLLPLLQKTMEDVWVKLQAEPPKKNTVTNATELPKETDVPDDAPDAAEKQRGRQRAQSRRGRGAQAASKRSRKKRQTQEADVSFTRNRIEGITMDETGSGSGEIGTHE